MGVEGKPFHRGRIKMGVMIGLTPKRELEFNETFLSDFFRISIRFASHSVETVTK